MTKIHFSKEKQSLIMCQACLTLEEYRTQPWLLEPGITWCRRRHYLTNTHDGEADIVKRSKMADSKFIDEVLKAHNEYRAKHQAPPLEHSKRLSEIAQKWANHLAEKDLFAHSGDKLDGQHLGENIAMKWSSGPDNYTGQEVTDQWYSEINMYVFGKEPSSLDAGHFTQVVWKGSKEIGVGKGKTKDGKILVVCNYFPAGNMMGTFTHNVLPKGKELGKQSHKEVDQGPGRKSHKEVDQGPFSKRFQGQPEMSRQGESRSVRTFTETTGSGPNAVTKTIVEETIIKADGTKVTNRKETTTTGSAGAAKMDFDHFKSIDSGKKDKEKDKEKDKKSGGFGFFKKKEKKRSGSSSSSSSDSSPERESLKDFQKNALKAHNECRKKHKEVSPLKLSKDLSEFAQKWADHLAASNSFQHSNCDLKGEKLGENIASKWSSSGADYTGKDVTEYWYSEIEKHKFGVEPSGSFGSGHFTQVVWKGSKEMGIGKAKTSSGKCIVVASYRPAGNLIGTFKENVPDLK